MKRILISLFIISAACLFANPLFAQPTERSLPFEKPSEYRGAEIFEGLNASTPPPLPSDEQVLQGLESYNAQDRECSFGELLSLSEFQRSHLLYAQNVLLRATESESKISTRSAEALLLSSLELLSSPSLTSADVRQAGNLLKDISPNAFASAPMLEAEYRFWLAEVLRSEHDSKGATENYTRAIECNAGDGFTGLVRFRRAELYEHDLRYIIAAQEFDTLASDPVHPLRLYASLRRASLLRTMGKFQALLAELSRSALLASDTSHLFTPSETRDLRYRSLFEFRLHHPELRHERILSTNQHRGEPVADTLMLASPYTTEEICLLKGSALSGLKQFDSAEFYFEFGERSLASRKDSLPAIREKIYLAHALRFERAWVKLSEGANPEAAERFHSIAIEDSSLSATTLIAEGNLGNTGFFYHDRGIGPAAISSVTGTISIDTSSFIYDDFPARSKFYEGIALSRAGKTVEARDVLTNLSQDPTALYADKARYHLALVEFKSGHSLQAEGLLSPIAMHRSQSGVFASILLGDIHYRRSSFAKAAEYFGFALANLPDNDTSLRAVAALERGLSLLPLGSWMESAQDLKLYVSLASNKTTGLDEALFWLGRAYFRSDSIPEARNCFKRLLDEFPNSSRIIDAQYGYAWTLFRNGEYKLADKEFAKVIEMDSITRYAYDALSRRGDALYAGGDLKKALAIYNLAVDRPTFNEYRTTRSLYQLGVIRMRSDSARSAMNAFHTIITKFPKSDLTERAYYDYAVAAYAIKQEEKGDEAVRTLAQKYKGSSFASKAIYLSASEDDREGNPKDALSNYNKVLKEYPNSEEYVPSIFGAVNALVQLKKYENALALSDSFFVKSPESPYAPRLFFRKGEIQILSGNSKNAAQTFEDFGNRFPNDTLIPMAKYMMGTAISYSNKEKAYGIYKEVVEKYPHSGAAPFAYLALARIEKTDRGNREAAAEDYVKAFDYEFYSSEAAPQAMFEYADYLKSNFGRSDSALHIYDDLTERYFIETTIGGKSALEASDILLSKGRKTDAVSKLEKLAGAQEGFELAAEARLRLGQLYRRDGSGKKALVEFDRAREDNNTTRDQLARSYLGSAECSIAAGDKKTARRLLAELLVTKGIARSRRDSGKELLESITPKKKQKHKGH